jgi:hypothetical protein
MNPTVRCLGLEDHVVDLAREHLEPFARARATTDSAQVDEFDAVEDEEYDEDVLEEVLGYRGALEAKKA